MKLTKASKIVISFSVAGWILIALLIFNTVNINAETDEKQNNVYEKMKLFNEVLFKLHENYVDEIGIDEFVDAAIDGMLDIADPHTVYFTPDEFDRFNTSTKGEFGGLGISIDKKGDYITVVSPIEGTPAYNMGIQAGDKIARVDGESVVGVSTDEVIKKMRGEKGTKVVIGIERPGVEEELEFEIIRDIIKINSIPYAFKLDNGIGYIRIRQFNANTTKELRQELDRLEEEGIRGLLIDLRFNPGGLLSEAVDTVNEFIGKDKLVVYTKGKNPRANAEYYTHYNRIRTGYPVIVLINESSASASEIFAGSLQDWDKGLVVGKTSFGKGSVQRLFPLSDGDGLKVTTAKYYIHSGRCIHKDLNDRILKGEEVSDEEKEAAEEDHLNDMHFTEKGRIVYGGGGVTPDIEIEQDLLNKFEQQLRRKNSFFNYSVEYMLDNEDNIEMDFYVSDEIVDDFLNFVEKDSIEYSEKDLNESLDWIKNEISSNVISRKYGLTEGYKISLKEDGQFLKTIDLFDRFDTLENMFEYAEELKVKEKQE